MTGGEAVRVRVWDRAVRVLHWTLATACALTGLSLIEALGIFAWHRPAGYVAFAALSLRFLWGFAGRDATRFDHFMRGPRSTVRYLHLIFLKREPRYLGHNPLGGWMVVALMLCVAGLTLTGWLYTTDRFWGNEAVESLHRALAWTLLVLVLLHLAGVIFTSLRHRENLVRAMLDGRKRAPVDTDIA